MHGNPASGDRPTVGRPSSCAPYSRDFAIYATCDGRSLSDARFRYDERGNMKPLPAPEVPGNTEAERMDNAVRKLFTVSKEAYLREEDRLKKRRERKKRAKKADA